MTTSHADLDTPGHDGAVEHHLTDDHGGDHGHDDHAHGEEPLGPVRFRGVGRRSAGNRASGAVIAFCFAMATGALG